MKYTVKITGESPKEIEAAQFFCEGRFVVFASATPQTPYSGMGGYQPPGRPQPLAAFPGEFIESITTDAVKATAS